jgi:hypothetical protein
MIAKGQARTTCAISRPVFWVPASTPLKKISLSQGAEALESHGIEVSAIRRASPPLQDAWRRTLLHCPYGSDSTTIASDGPAQYSGSAPRTILNEAA